MNVPPASVTRRASEWMLAPQHGLVAFLGAVAILMLYFRLLQVGTYNVTVGAICVPTVILLSLRRITLPIGIVSFMAMLILWPLIVFSGATIMEAALTPDNSSFLLSYALWLVSMLTLMAALITRSPVRLARPDVLCYIILSVAAIQVVIAGAFGSLAGFEVFHRLLGVDIYRGYIRMQAGWDVRAIGLYYEPSMCGRVLGTLAFIDYLRNRKLLRAGAILLATVILTKTLGLVVLAAGIGMILLGRSVRELFVLGVVGALVVAVQGASIQSRVAGDALESSESSTYRRTVAPIDTMRFATTNYPFGIAIGANSLVSEASGYVMRTGEPQITNGTYEFVLYFGIVGWALLGSALAGILLLVLRGEREFAAALLYVVMSTALSGSFLSIESTLLTYFFITACIAARGVSVVRDGNDRRNGVLRKASPRRPPYRTVPGLGRFE